METMEVVRLSQDSDFTYKDLIIFHQECVGGKFSIDPPSSHPIFEFTCQRCLTRFPLNPADIASIIRTAIDGKERQFRYGQKVIQKK